MIRMRVIDDRVRARLAHVDRAAKRPPDVFWRRIARDQRTLTQLMFSRLGRGEGIFRGERWEPFRPQYTRKTDGVEVPAWGGVPKVRGEGAVQGRKRPSGTRITPSSLLMQDIGRLVGQAASVHRIIRGGQAVEISTPAEYARKQNEARTFMKFTRADKRRYSRWAARMLIEP